ncbi:MAG: hypothetical protein AB1546_01150 [bacterium]
MNKDTRFHTISVILIFAVVAAVIALPFFLKSPQKRKEATIRANLKVIHYALKNYANEHKGIYPPTEKITGGDDQKDVLIKKGYIQRYPPNPCSGRTRPMQNVADKSHSCGDFVYKRSEDRYNFFLAAFGLKPDSGADSDGYIVKWKK